MLEVYISAEKRVNGEVDWYAVLDVNPLADDETLRKHYRKLALALHPDKNKSVGADGAFKIVSEAWSLLSDKAKRKAYDQRRNLKASYQNVTSGNPSMPARKNDFHAPTNNNNSNARNKKRSTNPHPTPTPPRSSKPNTFWTSCNRCMMQFEYLKIYLNQKLLCPSCHEPFLAVELPAPPTNAHNTSTSWHSFQQQQNANGHTANISSSARVGSVTGVDILQAPFSESGSLRSGSASTTSAARAPHVVQPACANLKRQHEETMVEEVLQRQKNGYNKAVSSLTSNAGSGAGKGGRLMKKRRVDEHRWNSDKKETTNPMEMGNGAGSQGIVSEYQKGCLGAERVGVSGSNKPKIMRELPQLEVRTMLMAKARMEIHKKLNEWSMNVLSKYPHKGGREMENQKPRAGVSGVQKATINGLKKGGNSACVQAKNPLQPKKFCQSTAKVDSDAKVTNLMLMTVPDPDFHDFDKDRTEKSFGENQVWAAYDNDDGMPRYYALVHCVISKRPFKMRISWLNSKSNSELGPLNWVGSGYLKTSGDFRVGKHEVNTSLNSFSHMVKWTKGAKGAIQIFPRKGDIWALYRNWSPDWNELTPNEVIHKYDMVEVLEDYSDELGVTVVPLVKVAGFKSVFHQHMDPQQIWAIPREEIFRFSHQVPSCLLTGQEAENAPKGCRELDPAAMALDLLQVITEAKEEDTVEDAGKAKKSVGLESDRKVYRAENDCKGKEKRIYRYGNNGDPEAVVRNAKEKQIVEDINKGKQKTRLAGIE
ncbi:unnamed protein product [Ilex paraguariensis]|uniref:J domain-containing protein n=1 Tax=Ilex paraguariensis TaxID=185542 RepID=A0ABC8TLD6_9AQUA